MAQTDIKKRPSRIKRFFMSKEMMLTYVLILIMGLITMINPVFLTPAICSPSSSRSPSSPSSPSARRSLLLPAASIFLSVI